MKFGVIGAGGIGQLRGQCVNMQPATELAFVVDVDRVHAAAVADRLDTTAFDDYRQAIEKTKPDAVIVSSPVQFHEEQCIHALEQGCHVLCEKPLSNRFDTCLRIYRAAESAGNALAVGFNHRYYPSFRFVKECLRAGRIGELNQLRVFGGHDGLANSRADWMYKGEPSGGGAMMDVGIHMTDLTRYLFGKIIEVYGMATHRVWHVEGSEDNATAVFKTVDGLPVSYEATWNEWKGYRSYVEAYGTHGMVRGYYAPMFNLLVTQEKPGGKRRREFKFYPEIILREKFKGWETTARVAFDGEVRDFLGMIEGREVDLADGWSGVRAVEIAEAIYTSTRSGAVQRLSDPPV